MGLSDDFRGYLQPVKVIRPICVVGPKFVSLQYLDMLTGRKLSDGIFGVTDVNGNLMFKVKGKLLSVHGKRILVDAAGNRILTFQKKNQDVADFKVKGNWFEKRCAVFAGESTTTMAEMNKS